MKLKKQKKESKNHTKSYHIAALVLCLLSASCLGQTEFSLWLNPNDVYSYTVDMLFSIAPQFKTNYTLTSKTPGFHVNNYKELIFDDLRQTPEPSSPKSALKGQEIQGEDQSDLRQARNLLLSCSKVRWLLEGLSASANCRSSIRLLSTDQTKNTVTYSKAAFPLIVSGVPQDALDYQVNIFLAQYHYSVIAAPHSNINGPTYDHMSIIAGTVNQGRQVSVSFSVKDLLGEVYSGYPRISSVSDDDKQYLISLVYAESFPPFQKNTKSATKGFLSVYYFVNKTPKRALYSQVLDFTKFANLADLVYISRVDISKAPAKTQEDGENLQQKKKVTADLQAFITYYTKQGFLSAQNCLFSVDLGSFAITYGQCTPLGGTADLGLAPGSRLQVFNSQYSGTFAMAFNHTTSGIALCKMNTAPTKYSVGPCTGTIRTLHPIAPPGSGWLIPGEFIPTTTININTEEQLIFQFDLKETNYGNSVYLAHQINATELLAGSTSSTFEILNNRGAKGLISGPGFAYILFKGEYSLFGIDKSRAMIDVTPRDIPDDYTRKKAGMLDFVGGDHGQHQGAAIYVKVIANNSVGVAGVDIPNLSTYYNSKSQLPVGRRNFKGNNLDFVFHGMTGLSAKIVNWGAQNRDLVVPISLLATKISQFDMLSSEFGIVVHKNAGGVSIVYGVLCTPSTPPATVEYSCQYTSQKWTLRNAKGAVKYRYVSKDNAHPGVVFFDVYTGKNPQITNIDPVFFSQDGKTVTSGALTLNIPPTSLQYIYFVVNGPRYAGIGYGNQDYVMISNSNPNAYPRNNNIQVFNTTDMELNAFTSKTAPYFTIDYKAVGISSTNQFCPRQIRTCAHDDRFLEIINNCGTGDVRILKMFMYGQLNPTTGPGIKLFLRQRPYTNPIQLGQPAPRFASFSDDVQFCPSGNEFHIWDPSNGKIYSKSTNDDNSIHD